MQMYKVFNQDRAIIFTETLKTIKLSDKDYLYSVKEEGEVPAVYQMFIQTENYQRLIFLVRNNLQQVVDKFISLFIYIEAAGGVIKSPNGNLLMIYRFSKWDLPKGKLEKNESFREAALRECMEETGVEDISIVKELESTCHIYWVDNQPYLKRTYWFEMETSTEMKLVPQVEEGIEKSVWMNRNEVFKAVQNSYASLKDLIINHYLK